MLDDRKISRSDANIVVTVATRDTTLQTLIYPLEAAHGIAMDSYYPMIGTGWGNEQPSLLKQELLVLSNSKYPRLSISSDERKAREAGGLGGVMERWFGLMGLTANMPHISEDHAGVLVTAYANIAMGRKSIFNKSRAEFTKKRESFIVTEQTSVIMRWPSGRVNVIEDILLQQIGGYGPAAYAERLATTSDGNFYVLAPVRALATILTLASIPLGFSPYVGTSIVMWAIGMFFNQVTTIHFLAQRIKTAGFFLGLGDWLGKIPGIMLAFGSRDVGEQLAVMKAIFRKIKHEFVASGGGEPM
jgi:hypothetical protein